MSTTAQEMYLKLLAQVLTNTLPHYWRNGHGSGVPPTRIAGMDWPTAEDPALTMVGMTRLEHIAYCGRQVFSQNIPGDFMECGVWRGGASIFMRATQKVLGEQERNVWVCDSFCGAPSPNPNIPADKDDIHHTFEFLRIPEETVRANFSSLGLLDDHVHFVSGFVQNSLPKFRLAHQDLRLSILRADCDTYEATTAILENLYPLVSDGGFVIIDDYSLANCRAATEDFRSREAIDAPLRTVDWTAVYWVKQ